MVIVPSAPAESLAWADRLSEPLLIESGNGGVSAGNALEAYRAVLRRYPGQAGAHLGAARCLFRLGRYRASVAEYLASRLARGELAMAIDFTLAAERIQKGLPRGRTVRYLVRRSRSKWIALTARRGAEGFVDLNLQRYEAGLRGEGTPVKVDLGNEECEQIGLFSSKLVPDVFFIQTAYSAGTASPNKVFIVEAKGPRLRVMPPLRSLDVTRIRAEQGAVWILVTPSVRLRWSDVYRVKNGRLSLATKQPPDFHRWVYARPTGEEARNYTAWMRHAAQLTIQRRRAAAIAAWEEAARCANEAVSGRTTAYPAPSNFGDVRVNLRQIRQRVTWLRQRDWNHWLLYRPYDWGLQVSPYRLGNNPIPDTSEGEESW